MRYTNLTALTAPDVTAISTGAAIDGSQVISYSVVGTVSSSAITMQFTVQGSNDVCTTGGNVAANFVPTNWFVISTTTITGSASTTNGTANSGTQYRWYRVVNKVASAGTGSMFVNWYSQSA